MKPVTGWSFTPYTPLDRPERARSPYITRLVPFPDGFEVDFIDNGRPDAPHTLLYRLRGAGEWRPVPCGTAHTAAVTGLDTETEYELTVTRSTDAAASQTRLVRTGAVPGLVVNYLHPEDDVYAFSGRYLCSPCLVRLPSGRLLSSMDVFEGNRPQNLTLIFASDDDGKTWHWQCELFPCFWGQMFVEGGRLYMLGMSTEYGDLLIGASDDEGRSWSLPTVLFRGSCDSRERGLHRAPMKLCRAYGRLWTDVQYGAWSAREMNTAVLSVPVGCPDYTDPAVWVMTDFWRHNEFAAACPGKTLPGIVGGIEGNIVQAPDGSLFDFLRYDRNKCLLLRIDPLNPEAVPTFEGLADIPITPSKFDIIWDEPSKAYWALCSRALDNPKTNRNLLSLFVSRDLKSWQCAADVIDERNADPAVVGFQYVSFLIEGDDILFLCRTAYGRPHNFHDSNYQTFHRIRGFRRTAKHLKT